jgi:hypothetical protein
MTSSKYPVQCYMIINILHMQILFNLVCNFLDIDGAIYSNVTYLKAPDLERLDSLSYRYLVVVPL